MKNTPDELISLWYEKVRRAQIAQYSAANKSRRLHFILGIPTAIISATTGTFIFYGVESISLSMPVIIASLSLIASILASIQTFIGPSGSISDHEKAAKLFGELKRRAQLAKACPPEDLNEWLNEFKKDWDHISEISPLASSPLFSKDAR